MVDLANHGAYLTFVDTEFAPKDSNYLDTEVILPLLFSSGLPINER